MGNLMRQFWMPACLSTELERGGPPMRLLLLGERLVAFRDGDGQVGIMDHRCPHRGASLFFGRVEQSGIRCVYHGWKFKPTGHCEEIPNAEIDPALVKTISAEAYPTRERNGVVWIYMGEQRNQLPELPQMEALLLDPEQVSVQCLQRKYNWLQGIEGDIDTSHFGFLHVGAVDKADVDQNNMHRYSVLDRAPKYHVSNTPWGTMYCAHRPAEKDEVYYRIAHFVYPFWSLFPDGDFNDLIVANCYVPMDDEHTMLFTFYYKQSAMAMRHTKDGAPIPGLEPDANHMPMPPTLPPTSDWYGRWRSVANGSNDYLIDRETQRTKSYTGLSGVLLQDTAIVESMGTIVDRSREHLVGSDAMIVRTRRALLSAVRELAEGKRPALVDDPHVVQAARSGSFIAPVSVPWRDAYLQHAKAATSPKGTLQLGVEKHQQVFG